MTSQQEQGTYLPYDFQRIYDMNGGKGKPIFTRSLLETRQKQYRELFESEEKDRCVKIELMDGTYIDMMLKTETNTSTKECERILRIEKYSSVKPKEPNPDDFVELKLERDAVFYIEPRGIEDLARHYPLSENAKRAQRREILRFVMMDMQCPSPFIFSTPDSKSEDQQEKSKDFEINRKEFSKWTDQWNSSQLRQNLVEALEENASSMPRVTKIVCFELGPLHERLDGEAKGFFTKHLAACTIAQTLERKQIVPGEDEQTIEIFAQDDFYDDSICKRALADECIFKRKINVADWRTAEGLAKIDKNTFVVSIDTVSTVLQPAIELAGPEGPAGVLHDKANVNSEDDWLNKKLPIGEEPPGSDTSCSNSEWEYRKKCIKAENVTDDEIFGYPPKEKGDRRVDTELLLRKKQT